MILMLMAQITAQTMVMAISFYPQTILAPLPLLQARAAQLKKPVQLSARAAVFRFPLLATLLTTALVLPQATAAVLPLPQAMLLQAVMAAMLR